MRSITLCRASLTLTALAITLVLGVGATAYSAAQPALVRVAPVTTEAVAPHRTVTGVVRARRMALLASRESGLVVDFSLESGEHIKQGEVIATLDAESADLEVRQREAEVTSARAAVERRKAEFDDAEDDLQRTRELTDRGTTSEREVVTAEIAKRVAEAQLAEAESDLELEQVRLADAERRRRHLEVRAPFDAIVVEVHTQLGEWLETGGDVVTVIEDGRFEAVLDLPERLITAGRNANSIEVSVTGLGQSVNGRPLAIVPTSDARAGLVPLRVEIEPTTAEQAPIVPGMRVTASLPEGDPVQTLFVPKDAVNRDPAGEYVYVAPEGSGDQPPAAVRVNIRVLFAIGDRVAVQAERLAAGSLVVVDGNERLRPGQTLNITQGAPE